MQPALTPLERQQLHAADTRITFWHRVRFDLVLQLARERGVHTIHDIGAGSGLLADYLATSDSTLEYRFEEESDALAAPLAERLGADARAGDHDPVPSTTMVTVLDVIEHIDDDHAFVAALARRCAPGTTVVATVPAHQWLFSSWDVDLGHHRRYGRRDIIDVFTAAGWRVDECSHLFPELLPPAVLRRFRRSGRGEAEFPALPRWVDSAAYTVGAATMRLRRVWPAGTSIVVVATAPGAAS